MGQIAGQGPIRILILDVDGTLAGANRQVSPRVRQAVAQARERGVQVALCTGRPRIAAHFFVTDLGLNGYHIFDAGATIVDPLANRSLFHKGIDLAVAHEIIDEARTDNLYLEAYGSGGYFVERPDHRSLVHAQIQGADYTVIDLHRALDLHGVTKLEMMTQDAPERARAQALLDRFADRIDYGWATAPGSDFDFVNLLARGVSKGEAVERLLDHLDIPAEAAMGAGDGSNDEPMLHVVGTAIAMGDGPESLKAIADWVAPDVQHDGLADAIDRFILSR